MNAHLEVDPYLSRAAVFGLRLDFCGEMAILRVAHSCYCGLLAESFGLAQHFYVIEIVKYK